MYTGSVEAGIKTGKGCMHFENGDIYLGQWKNNIQNGFGVMIYQN